jgi:DNA-methyltransferase (dcm)
MSEIMFLDDDEFTCIDFFCGIGGIKTAFERHKIRGVCSIDIDSKCKQTFDTNFPNKLLLRDITTIDEMEYADVFTLGFNCQPFSVAGKQKGFQDERTQPLFTCLKLIEKHRPKCVFMENVKNLQTHDEKKSLTYIIERLEQNYTVFHTILNTRHYSILPHNRERLFITAFRKDLDCSMFSQEFPKIDPHNWRTFLQPEDQIPDKYYYKPTSKIYPILQEACTSRDIVYQYRRTHVRENKNQAVPCLTANMGSGGHNVGILVDNKGIRKFTPRECFRFQGFPDSYQFPNIADSCLYKQIGNSVSIPIIELFASQIHTVLMNNTTVPHIRSERRRVD